MLDLQQVLMWVIALAALSAVAGAFVITFVNALMMDRALKKAERVKEACGKEYLENETVYQSVYQSVYAETGFLNNTSAVLLVWLRATMLGVVVCLTLYVAALKIKTDDGFKMDTKRKIVNYVAAAVLIALCVAYLAIEGSNFNNFRKTIKTNYDKGAYLIASIYLVSTLSIAWIVGMWVFRNDENVFVTKLASFLPGFIAMYMLLFGLYFMAANDWYSITDSKKDIKKQLPSVNHLYDDYINSKWMCIKNKDGGYTPITRNSNGNIMCMSDDGGTECIWRDSEGKCKLAILDNASNSELIHLECGDDHAAKKKGTSGYDTEGHWCQLGNLKLGSPVLDDVKADIRRMLLKHLANNIRASNQDKSGDDEDLVKEARDQDILWKYMMHKEDGKELDDVRMYVVERLGQVSGEEEYNAAMREWRDGLLKTIADVRSEMRKIRNMDSDIGKVKAYIRKSLMFVVIITVAAFFPGFHMAYKADSNRATNTAVGFVLLFTAVAAVFGWASRW